MNPEYPKFNLDFNLGNKNQNMNSQNFIFLNSYSIINNSLAEYNSLLSNSFNH